MGRLIQKDSPPPISSYWPLAPLVVAIVVLMGLYAYVFDHEVTTDDGGFLSPVLEYVHTGHVVYPAHGFPHSMPVHPPVHYWLMGVLVKMGLNFYPAAGSVFLIFGVIAVLAIVLSPFSDVLKISLLAGAFLPNFALLFLDLRPEVDSTLAWLAGLVLLESARLLNWDARRLVAGSFLVAYASGLQYFALPALGACVVYAAFAVLGLGWPSSWKKVAYLALGTGLFVAPYLTLFFIPEHKEILERIRSQSPSMSPLGLLQPHLLAESLGMQRDLYHQAFGYLTEHVSRLYAALSWPLKPIFTAAIPAFFVSTPILLIFRQVRVLVIAALPVELSLVFITHHKGLTYLRNELSLLYTAEFAIALVALAWVLRHALSAKASTLLLSSGLALFFVVGCPAFSFKPVPLFVDDLALARASGKAMLGNDAIVGGRSICLWFTSGGRIYRNVTGDLIYPPDISGIDPQAYFSRLDGIAEDGNGSWATYNKQKMALSSWYLNGTLDLQGFYAGHRYPGDGSSYNFFMTAWKRKRPVQSWFWRGNRFYHFREDPSGSYALVAVIRPDGFNRSLGVPEGEMLAEFGLPPDHKEYLSFHVIPRTSRAELGAKLPEGWHLRDLIGGTVELTNPKPMLESVDYQHEIAPIFFDFPTLAAAIAKPVASQDALPVKLHNVNPKGSLDISQGETALRYHIASTGSEALLYSPTIDLSGGGRYVLEFNLRIRSGSLVITIKDKDQRVQAAQIFRAHTQPWTDERLMIDAREFPQVMLMVWSYDDPPGSTNFDLANVHFWKAAPDRYGP
jgi:hypothetical protein